MEEIVKLHIHNVSKTYHSDGKAVLAIDEVDLKIKDKEFATILGPSGCGKSTLLRIVAGLIKPTRGVVKEFPGVVRIWELSVGEQQQG